MSERTNESDIAAVTEVARAYYDGMMAGGEAKLARAFHPRACIVGNEEGELYWATLEEFVAECKETIAQAGSYEWRIDGLSFEGDTALIKLGGQYAGVWYSDDLSMVRTDGAWRIVHKTFYAHPVCRTASRWMGFRPSRSGDQTTGSSGTWSKRSDTTDVILGLRTTALRTSAREVDPPSSNPWI